MGAERKPSLTIAQFLDSINSDCENMGDLSSQLLAGAAGTWAIEDGGPLVPRKDSGAYIAALLERALHGQIDKAGVDAIIADLPSFLTEDATPREIPEAIVPDSNTGEEKRSDKGDAAVATGDWEPEASEELSFKKQCNSQGDDESEVSDENGETNNSRKRPRQQAASDAEAPTEGEVATVSRAVIEPKISKVDVNVIPVKEARRVLNNRKSARKSYIRKKERMKTMEERVARYEVQFASVDREFRKLMGDYERVLEENRILKERLGFNMQQQALTQPHLPSVQGHYWQ